MGIAIATTLYAELKGMNAKTENVRNHTFYFHRRTIFETSNIKRGWLLYYKISALETIKQGKNKQSLHTFKLGIISSKRKF